MTARADLPAPDDLPIPADVRPGPGWTEQMREMADHIGAFDTLRIVDARGGEQLYIPRDPERSPFAELIGDEAVRTLAWVYGGHHYAVPVGRVALARARRAPIIAGVRAKTISGSDAAKLLRTSRTYLAQLVNQSDEGRDAAPIARPRAKRDPRQIDLFNED